MDHILTSKIHRFLQLKNPTEEEIRHGATLLLQCNPGRERAIYNSAMARPKSMLPWIRADLKKYYGIRQRGIAAAEIEKFNQETLTLVRESLSKVPESAKDTDEEKEEENAGALQIGVKGKREDHDQLPAEIQAIWPRNMERWKKMRQVHAQLSQMIARPDYAPCDGNELCYQLRQMDDELRNDYRIYDTYVIKKTKGAESGSADDSRDEVEVFTDNVKTIQNARTAVSRGLARKSEHTEESLKTIQDAVNTLYALKQVIKPKTIEKLKAIGIVIPTYAEG